MQTQWQTLQPNRVQGSQNKPQPLTYAQKVAGQQKQAIARGQPQSEPPQQPQAQGQTQRQPQVQSQQSQSQQPDASNGSVPQPQFRMVPAQNILGAQPSNMNMTASALSNYAYPYNYTHLQHTYQQQPQHPRPHPRAHPHHHSHRNHHSPHHQPQQQRRGAYGQRDFFDRRVQNNVNSAVSQYYNNNSNRANHSHMQQRRSHRPYGQKPSYSSSSASHAQRSASFKNAPNVNKMKQRGKPSDSQLATYEAAADRDVLCWIYENQGKCRYGEKCQWLHLDRETGKYVPTVYIMNSLDINKAKQMKKGKENQNTSNEMNATEDPVNDDQKKDTPEEHDKEEEEHADTEELQKKFQLLMEKTIKRNLANEKEKEEEEEVEQEEAKEKEKDDDKKQVENEKEVSTETDKGKGKGKGKAKGYGSYGTTFDRHNVCWEFNTFVGCRKGSKCKWAHQYLIKEASHPYTGEKLNGMAVRKFRLSHNL
eukprot:1136399_1